MQIIIRESGQTVVLTHDTNKLSTSEPFTKRWYRYNCIAGYQLQHYLSAELILLETFTDSKVFEPQHVELTFHRYLDN